jgi:ubiquinone/menaquinone biosynthesis C-methylase UbiE
MRLRQTARMSSTSHDHTILDQFTKQAVPFASAPIHQDGMDLIRAAARLTAADEALDVACGPGLVACALAPYASHVTGVDLTPRMIEEAAATAARLGVSNVTWITGSATPLPFPDALFPVVLTRYSFHHFADPAAALAEMFRVCRPGGRVVVADLSIPAPEGRRFDAVEQWRDPSHVHALAPEELRALFAHQPVAEIDETAFGLPIELEPQLTRSFPVEGGADRVRRAYAESVAGNTLGIDTRVVEGRMWSTWPIRVIGATKRA